jgi:phosphoribosylformylglycinamidine synthase
VLVGPFSPSLAGSELAKLRGELDLGLPTLEISDVARALAFVREEVRSGEVRAAHDVSDGGLATAIGEMAIAGEVGIEADLDSLVELRGGSGETSLFGEGPGGVLLAVAKGQGESLVGRAREAGVDALVLGSAGGERIELSAAEREVSVLVADAATAWNSLGERVER